jgi:Tol biopolymer transport system component
MTVLRASTTLALCLLTAGAAQSAGGGEPVAKQFERHVCVLAADDMEGRGLGTRGIDKAAAYLETQLRALKLKPAFGSSYRQPFKVKTGVALAEGNRLSGVAKDDWTPLGFSSSGAFKGPLVFAGYGIHAEPLGYDDFAGVDLKGKVALILRYEPQERDEKSIFDGKRPSRWSALRYKLLQARERGAAAVIFVNGPLQDEGKNKVPALANDGPESPAGIPVLQVKTSVAESWGLNLKEFQDAVDMDLKPRSRQLPVVIDGKVAVTNNYASTANLAGILPGRGPLADEVMVVGAHYDHLGYGGTGSMKPNVHAIHHGADDNASGDAGVLLIAQQLSHELADAKNRRTILFALFSGEEVGLAGSEWFVDHPPVPLARVKAMLNLDMIGNLRDDQLVALGADTATEWQAPVVAAAAAAKLAVNAHGDGYGPSDQTSFYVHQIPVLHLFTGAHERYHTPEDTADKLNYEGAARIVDFASRVVGTIARGDVSPKYVRATAAPAMEGDSRGYGAYLGTVPDYRAMESASGGVLLADVRAGGPAEKAGIKGGDRIVEIAGTKIENLYDMTFALQDHKPGETVDVVLIRDNQKKTLRATLGTRGATASPAPAPSGHPLTGGEGLVIKAGKPFAQVSEGEKHLADIRQLTFGGENAEAYWSPDGTKLIFQSTPRGAQCDQEYILDLAGGETKLVSSGKGRTTCGYFSYPKGERIIYATTEAGGAECPPPPDRSQGYVWAVYPTYDIVEAKPDGSGVRRLTSTPGYDAEATWCAKGGKFIFTSMRDGDLDLYESSEDGKVVKRLTSSPGYDGGAFYSPDCSEIVWRAYHPEGKELDEYRALLAKNLVKPTKMELFVANADGSNARQITNTGAANFCPFFTPDGKRIIYSSNAGDPKGREFDLWLIDKKGGAPERITTAAGFDGFPMFSPDGKWLVWASNRADVQSHETNLFIARWIE